MGDFNDDPARDRFDAACIEIVTGMSVAENEATVESALDSGVLMWTTASGEKIKFSDMSSQHLKNAYYWVRRQSGPKSAKYHYRDAIRAELIRRGEAVPLWK